MDKQVIITIGREYGSGGRQIGKEIANYFGIKYYDKELLEHAANDSGICKELFEHHDEKPTNSFLYTLVMDPYSLGFGTSGELPLNHKVFLAAFDTIKSIAEKDGVFSGGDCVTGPATVIRAIAAGKVAAANIDNYLGFNHKIESGVVVPEPRIENKTPCGRVTMMERNTTERKKDFNIVENGMTCKEANQEAHRCLRCDRFGYGVFKGGRVEEW